MTRPTSPEEDTEYAAYFVYQARLAFAFLVDCYGPPTRQERPAPPKAQPAAKRARLLEVA